MSEELKSYLCNIKYEIETSDIELEKLDLGLNAIMWEELLDYITNLQEQLHQASLDIQELTEKDIGCPSWCDKLTNLEEENKRYKRIFEGKERFSKIMSDDTDFIILSKADYDRQQDNELKGE